MNIRWIDIFLKTIGERAKIYFFLSAFYLIKEKRQNKNLT
jgi:hypothetical protein